MTSREKVNNIFRRKATNETAMWTGHPSDGAIDNCVAAWGIEPTREAIYQYLDDDCRWIRADAGYRHPEGLPMFNTAHGIARDTLSAEGCFAGAEKVSDLDDYPWPDVKYCDFTSVYAEIEKFPDKMVFTGMWCPFFHLLADFFGMENFFMKMYDCPEVVEALTERIVDFYVEADEKFFAGLGDRADAMFFGNDFGTQLDLFLSPALFRRFILPSFKRLIAVGKKHNKIAMLHSCGSIYRIIPDLIEAGVDVLHPIQAQAMGMSAAELAPFKKDIAFLGGIDAQSFFVNATPAQMKDEVRRVRDVLGPNIVISPSHEEILPNVPPANLLAMAEAARE